MKLSAVDRWIIGYSLFSSLVALLVLPDQGALIWSHALHVAAIVSALLVARWGGGKGRFAPYIRYGYPIVFFGLFYRDTGYYIFTFFSHWFDPALIRFEEAVLGFNLISAIAKVDWPWLLDLWMFGYLFYYLMPPLAVAVMIWRKRPDLFRRELTAMSAAFFVSYVMFYFFPLEGPRYAMVDVLPPLKGIVFYPVVMAIQHSGSVHGGCMPSSHTAVSWVVTYYVRKADRRVGNVLIFISTLLSIGCFWGRFHYLTDVVVGLLIFAVSVYVTERYNAGAGATVPARG